MSEEKVREAISTFYKAAGVNKKYDGQVNENVANIFGEMLKETKKCTDALVWVPTPSGGKASISWIARNFAKSVLNRMKDDSSLTCAKRVIQVWDRELQMAGMGL
ncbi:hypothetical protein [Pseudoalteromonas prydzensis]|uniref:hypothetical protein n=1 Tax=Pseudoalteromonas prydzensis TaxID=182141 RepID=UPI0024BCE270|nr:hypothetical protein [Pseudoalteromonas prydzensis]